MWLQYLIPILVTGCFNGISADLSKKQVYLSEKSRFIKFDTKENEVEIELGISIPVVKIPLAPEVGRRGVDDSGISISAPGLVVAGVLMFTSFIVVPLLFSNKLHFKSDDSKDVWRDIQRGMHNIASSSCMENLICWTAKNSKDGKRGSIGKWMDNFFRSEWAQRLFRGTFIEDAISTGRKGLECSKKFPNCQILKKIIR